MNRRYCLTLDLKDDPQLIRDYETHHQRVWPEVLASISDADIVAMEIYRFENRLMMVMEVGENFSFETKAKMDEQNPKVQEWEQLMWTYQQALRQGEKWILMEKIFDWKKDQND